MKLTFASQRKSKQIGVTFPGEIVDRLDLLRDFLRQVRGQEHTRQHVIVKIVEAFLAKGDPEFIHWVKEHTDRESAEKKKGEVRDNTDKAVLQ